MDKRNVLLYTIARDIMVKTIQKVLSKYELYSRLKFELDEYESDGLLGARWVYDVKDGISNYFVDIGPHSKRNSADERVAEGLSVQIYATTRARKFVGHETRVYDDLQDAVDRKVSRTFLYRNPWFLIHVPFSSILTVDDLSEPETLSELV